MSLVFAGSSLALLASLVWMVKVDYARPWRGFQDHYADLQASLAYFDVLSNQTQESLEKLAQAQDAVAKSKSRLEAQQRQTRQLIASLSGQDASAWTPTAEALSAEFSGPLRKSYEDRARAVSESLGQVVADQAGKPDAPALADRIGQDAPFRTQLVQLLEWFDLQRLAAKADGVRGEYARADMAFKAVKGDLNVAAAAYEHEKTLKGEEGHRTREALAHLEKVRGHFEEARRRVDELADLQKAVEDQRKLLQAEVISAERALARIEKDRKDAESRYADFASTLRRGAFNLPMLDFAAPKGTRGRQEIQQAVLPDVRIELNFVQGYQTDRCMTCHVAIADKNFTKEALAVKLEQAILAINEELDRQGRTDRKLTLPTIEERQDLKPGQVARGWQTLTLEQQDQLFARLRDEVNKYQVMRGLAKLEFGQPLLAHPNLELYVAADSKHPMARMGCTVCHEGNGEETDFVLAAHTPKSKEERARWKRDYYVRTAGILPEQNFETAEHHWTRPMLVPKYSEAGCVKCHSKAADIAVHEDKPAATRINEGRFLFTSLGCINCHLVEELADSRKVGPDLSHLGEKVTRGFAENWILFPHDYRPSTNMPHYFLQENNDEKSETGGGDADPVLRTRTEVVAMAEYLFAASDGYAREAPPEDLWAALKDESSAAAKAAAERGRRLFGATGCLACHANLAYRPDDENGVAGASLGEQWIVNDQWSKLIGLAQWAQTQKALRLKARAVTNARKDGLDPAEVRLGEEAKELLALDKEDGGKGIALPALQKAFEESFGPNGYDVTAARRRLRDSRGVLPFKGVLPQVDPQELEGLALSEEEQALAEISEEASTGLYEIAAARYAAMSYVQRVEYAMRHFNNAYDTLFKPDRIRGPIFTRFAPELSSMRGKFADYERAVAWLYDWIRNPRHYSSYTKMPALRLQRGLFPAVDPQTGEVAAEKVDADQALDIAVYLATLNDNAEFAEKAAKTLPEQDGQDATAYAAKRDELLRTLLGGLNSAAGTEAILRDEGGAMSEQLVRKLVRSLGEAEARRRVAAMDLEQRRWVFLGDKMIGHYGCYACHQVRGYETAARPGTELTAWGEKQLTQLDFAFFEHAFEHEREKDPRFRHLYPFDCEKLIACAGTNPPEEIEHTLASFAWHKVRNPRIYDRKKLKGPYEKLKMPNFFLNDEQADAIVTFLLSRKPARVNPSLQVDYAGTPAGRIADGRNLARELNCVACHKIDGNAAVMHQYITRIEGDHAVFDEVNGPPWLRGQGAKVRNEWFYGFLNNVQMLRPWLKVKMPSFHLDTAQGTRLVEYFVGLSQQESAWLAETLMPVERYLADARRLTDRTVLAEGESRPGTAGDEPLIGNDPVAQTGNSSDAQGADAKPADAAQLPPGADWYQKEALSRQAKALRDYAVANRLVSPSALNPTDNAPEDLAAAHAEIVEKAAFLQRLYNVDYPFARSGGYVPSETAAADGEVLFYELKCLACHVFGDPTVPGAQAHPTAPNLQLTESRLHSDWVRMWLEAPNRIQPGTKMPNVFGMEGRKSAFGDAPEADRARLAAQLKDKSVLDDPVKQREALTAFLYDAGARRLNKVQPADSAATQPAGEAPAEAPAEEPAEEPKGETASPPATAPAEEENRQPAADPGVTTAPAESQTPTTEPAKSEVESSATQPGT